MRYCAVQRDLIGIIPVALPARQAAVGLYLGAPHLTAIVYVIVPADDVDVATRDGRGVQVQRYRQRLGIPSNSPSRRPRCARATRSLRPCLLNSAPLLRRASCRA